MRTLVFFTCLCAGLLHAVDIDVSGVRPGPVKVTKQAESVTIDWPDEQGQPWQAEFSLNPARPLITRMGPAAGKPVISGGDPLYDVEVGIRRGGFDEFFDNPSLHPDGTRRHLGVFRMTAATAKSVGDRVELLFDGLKMGPFSGGVAITIFPGSRLIQQEALVTTTQENTAYYYNAGIRMKSPADAGEVMNVPVSYYDTAGQFQTIRSRGPERAPLRVRHRATAMQSPDGTVVAFPAPHQYFMPRDFSSNMGFSWHFAWRGNAAVGIRQYPDDNTRFYPWMNAPPHTLQRMSLFYTVDSRGPKPAVDAVLRYTNNDRFPDVAGFRKVAAHWHLNFTVQAMQNGPDWVPPFKAVMKNLGIDAAFIMDFHGDGHPGSIEDVRLKELDAMQKFSRMHSDKDYLIVPGEEANVWLGGHYCVMFPKAVNWFMKRPEGTPLKSTDAKGGTVWHTGSADDVLQMLREEKGIVWQAHPRNKGSLGYPDKIKDTEHFKDRQFFAAGWKAMPTDTSRYYLSDRSFRTLDDFNNWGFHKIWVGEADMFQIDTTHELYAHLNINYVKLPQLPDYDHYGEALKALVKGDGFISTGEILLPEVKLGAAGTGRISAKANVSWTFPLRVAEVVWGDGTQTHRKVVPMDTSREFGKQSLDLTVDAPNWKWVRFAVWDVAGNGAFTQPVWNGTTRPIPAL
ncbi:MAG: hypothetical protein SGI92_18245 [Bryobacteraceae bacterium]|nr:hypothetical protein [Bryobacteraceae bacterium]